MNAFYTFRENRELAMLAWDGLKTRDAMRDAFERFVAALHTGTFGKIGGSMRVATGSAYDPSIETCSVSELALYSRDDQWLVDAKLELQPPVKASDGRIELIELAEDESPLGEVTLRPFGEHWSVIGTPAKVRDESLLFVEVDFDPPGNGGSMIAWFRSKTDLWLAYGLDGEPTGPDQQANRRLLIDALRDVAAQTDATLELRELDRAP